MFPIDDTAMNEVFALLQTKYTQSPCDVAERAFVVAVVVELPILID